jgi:hypothetical protein
MQKDVCWFWKHERYVHHTVETLSVMWRRGTTRVWFATWLAIKDVYLFPTFKTMCLTILIFCITDDSVFIVFGPIGKVNVNTLLLGGREGLKQLLCQENKVVTDNALTHQLGNDKNATLK